MRASVIALEQYVLLLCCWTSMVCPNFEDVPSKYINKPSSISFVIDCSTILTLIIGAPSTKKCAVAPESDMTNLSCLVAFFLSKNVCAPISFILGSYLSILHLFRSFLFHLSFILFFPRYWFDMILNMIPPLNPLLC